VISGFINRRSIEKPGNAKVADHFRVKLSRYSTIFVLLTFRNKLPLPLTVFVSIVILRYATATYVCSKMAAFVNIQQFPEQKISCSKRDFRKPYYE
jgi:hypothetical protein